MSSARRAALAATGLVWALAVAGGVAWGLKLFSPGLQAPAHARPAPAVSAVPPLAATDLSRLLGADEAPRAVVNAAPAPSDPRYQLLGVVASKAAAPPALAVIAVDGKPARAYRVGAVLAGDTVLRAVHAKAADLGPRQGPVALTLQVPAASIGGVAAAPPMNLPPAAPPPAMPTTMPPGRVMPSFTPPARGANPLQPRVPYGVTPSSAPGAAAQPVSDVEPVVQTAAEVGMAQNPAGDPSQPVRRRNLPADTLR